MKLRFIVISILLGMIMLLFAKSDSSLDLNQYQWKNRLILIFSPSDSDSLFQDANHAITLHEEELLDRDIILFYLFEKGESTVNEASIEPKVVNSLRKTYQIEPGKFTLVLVGKDGGEKLRQQDSFDFQVIFDRIDAMPMRIREMRENKQ
jgi:hypothetical protein